MLTGPWSGSKGWKSESLWEWTLKDGFSRRWENWIGVVLLWNPRSDYLAAYMKPILHPRATPGMCTPPAVTIALMKWIQKERHTFIKSKCENVPSPPPPPPQKASSFDWLSIHIFFSDCFHTRNNLHGGAVVQRLHQVFFFQVLQQE